jgi:hypothetical protein
VEEDHEEEDKEIKVIGPTCLTRVTA